MEDIALIIRRVKRSGEGKLNLSGKQLISIPPEIYSLKLQYLDLSNNKLTSVEPRIATLTSLEIIDFSNNCIEEMPEEIASLPNLQQLNLLNNPLFPKYLPLLGNLKKNQLTSVFQSVFIASPVSRIVLPIQDERPKTQQQLRQLQIKAQNELNGNSKFVMELDSHEFEVGEIISQGGFSIVHKGSLRGCDIAIKKIFNPNITQQLMDEINNEIEMLSILRHPNIVLLMAVSTKPPNLIIATEFIGGGSLFQLLHKSNIQLSEQQKYSIALQMAKVLQYMHQSGIVHRDIKSHNVLLQGNTVKLCDFGLAKRVSELNIGNQQFSGTPTYMAPELFAKRAYDKGVDLFAFGTLLWEIFAREVPFDGLDLQDIIQRVMKNEQLPTKNVPKNIMQLVSDLRSKDENKRPSMENVVQQLKRS